MIPVYDKSELKKAEQDGMVADSMIVRLALMERVKNKEISLEKAQEELKKIQRQAHRQGLYTRNDIATGKNIDLQYHVDKAKEKQKQKLDKILILKPQNKIHKI